MLYYNAAASGLFMKYAYGYGVDMNFFSTVSLFALHIKMLAREAFWEPKIRWNVFAAGASPRTPQRELTVSVLRTF